MSSSGGVHESKRIARQQFEKWALTYDRSFLNELVFFPSVRACQQEIAGWRLARTSAPAPDKEYDGAMAHAYDALDVGCGTGRLLSLLARDASAGMLVGLDYSPNMVRAVAQKIRELQLEEKLHVVNGDAERLPFADRSFDVITCCNSFHHYPHQAGAIREFKRALRPGGTLILIDGFRDNVIGWVVFDVFVAGVEKHVHHASWREVRDMALASGFASVVQRKLNVLAPLLVTVARR